LERRGLLEEIATAAAETDKRRLTELLASPKLRGYPLEETLSRAVAAVDERLRQRRLTHRQDLVRALAEGQPGRFGELFDEELVREICRDQPRHQTVAQRWTETEILPRVREQLTLPVESGLTQDGQTVYHARWQWPEKRLTRLCEVAVCREPPKASAAPSDVEAVYRSQVARAEDETCDGAAEERMRIEHVLVVPPEWSPSVVVVWGAVDLGFQTLYTEAVELGRIEPPTTKKGRWGFR
jgi:hypothetical protein